MADIRPFKAVIYNSQKIKDLSKVICPPYDVISEERQQYFHALSPYNFIRIILAKEAPGQDKYRRSAELFEQWQKEGVLARDEKSAFYFYSQQYNLQREKKIRLGFIGLLRVGHNKTSAFGHEHTRLEPKEDRLRLLRQVKANLSPIFVIYHDRQRLIQSTYQQHVLGQHPFVDITDGEGVTHKLWRLQAIELLEKIQEKMRDESIFIADGHHRYEVACNYLEEISRKRQVAADEGINYILTYFTNTESRGLNIMPIHRLVKLDDGLGFEEFLLKLGEYFNLTEVPQRQRFFFLMQKAGFTERVIGMYKEKRYWILRLKNIRIMDKIMADSSMSLRMLDVSVLNQIIFKKILGFQFDDNEHLSYIHDPDELIKKVDTQSGCVGFFLNAVKVDQITQVALNQEKMPPKSTYFYPKVLSGLVVSKHDIAP